MSKVYTTPDKYEAECDVNGIDTLFEWESVPSEPEGGWWVIKCPNAFWNSKRRSFRKASMFQYTSGAITDGVGNNNYNSST